MIYPHSRPLPPRPQGKLLAVKRLHIAGQRNAVHALANEIQLMREFRHRHIVRYIGAAVDERDGVVNIFQEWVPGGSVAHMLKVFGPFAERVVAKYTRQILLGLRFLHENGIVHRDIKGGNVLVHENGTVKLADFGASTRLDKDFNQTQATDTVKGTPYFMAPEVLAESKYGRKGDIWAVGCTMIQMLTGQPPWKDRNLSTMVQLHLLLQSWRGPPPYDSEDVSGDCRDVLELCFQHDSASRPHAEELLTYVFLQETDDLDRSWSSQQLGSGRFSNPEFAGGGGRSSGDGKDSKDEAGLGASGSINELMLKMQAVAAGGHVWQSLEAEDDSKGVHDGSDQQTERVRRQVTERQRAKERRNQRGGDGGGEDGEDEAVGAAGKDAEDEELSDLRDVLPPSKYGSPSASGPAAGAHNPFARGASGPSRQPARVAAGAGAGAGGDARAEAKDGGHGHGQGQGQSSAPAATASRPVSRETKADSKVSTPKSTTSSAASTPTHGVRGKTVGTGVSPPREDRPLLRVQTRRDQQQQQQQQLQPQLSQHSHHQQHHYQHQHQHQPLPLSLRDAGSRPTSKEAAAAVARGSSHGERGLSSARDTEDVTPSPYPDRDEGAEEAWGEGEGEGEDEDEVLVSWTCEHCDFVNDATQNYCDKCAKTRVRLIVDSNQPSARKIGV